MLALFKAAQSFNPDKAKFSTWAYRPVFWQILKYVQKEQKYQSKLNEYKKSIQNS